MRAGPAVIAAVVGILACAAWQRWPVAARQVVNAPPRHIALIPDGNRRWARSQGLSVAQGHRAGMSALGPVAAAAWDGGAEVVTFWWGSPANLLKRDPDEVVNIIRVLAEWLPTEGVSLLRRYNAELELGGRWRELAPALIPAVESAQQALATSLDRSQGRTARKLLVLVGYDGQEEILAAAAEVGGKRADVDRAAFEAALWTGSAPPVDLIVRSAAAGEPHLSAGFMLWHIANAQLSWLPDYWPAVRPKHIHDAIEAFRGTQRRMGK